MTKRILTVLISIGLAIVCNNPALSSTWQDVLSSAKANNNEVKSAQKNADSAYWQYNKAFTSFLPQISANASGSKSKSGTAASTTSYSYGISATQYLFTGLQNYYDLQNSYIQYKYALASLKAAEADVYYNLRIAYIDLLTAQNNIELQKRILEKRKENTRLIGLRYQSGLEDKGNFLLTKSNQTQSEHDLKSAMRNLELVKLKLSQTAGVNIDRVESLEASSQYSEKTDNITLATRSPSYLLAKYLLDEAEINNRATVSEFLPSISVSANYSKSDSSWPPQGENKSVSLNMSYSLFPGGSNIADIYINSKNYEKAVQDFEKSKKDIIYGVESADSNYKDLLEQLSVDRITLSAKTERAKITQQQYLGGLLKYNDWYLSENDSISTQIGVLNSEINAYYAQAALYKSYGGFIK